MLVRRGLPMLAAAIVLAAASTACRPAGDGAEPAAETAETPEQLQARAERLAKHLLIVDGHVDLPYRLEEVWQDVSQRTESGDFDYPRAVAGGLDAPFMSIYVPASFQKAGGAGEVADGLINMVERIAAEHPDKFAIAASPDEVRAVVASGRIALPLGLENGAPIEDLDDLRHFYDRGIRYVTLTHSEANQICDSSYGEEKPWGGLSDFGREVVAGMNRLGIMVDVSHVSDQAFWDVMEVTEAPAIASHSSARHFTPGFERNMSDEMIRRLAENGGVIMINFGSAFLREDAQRQGTAFWAARSAFMAEHGHERGAPEVEEWMKEYREREPPIFADVTDVADHIDHVVELVGVDHVGFGSDFDGVGDSLPTGLKDASQFPNLIRELLARGYSEEDLAKIAGENVMRVWSEVERVAREKQAAAAPAG